MRTEVFAHLRESLGVVEAAVAALLEASVPRAFEKGFSISEKPGTTRLNSVGVTCLMHALRRSFSASLREVVERAS